MSGWVDHFVIVEAATTFTGLPKPLHFQEQRAAFARFADKIIHVPIERFPDHVAGPWQRDCFQRDMAVAGISGLCAPDDLVILTDMDEIVRKEALDSAAGLDLAALEVRTFIFFYNCEQLFDPPKIKPVIARAKLLAQHGSTWLKWGGARFLKRQALKDGGWHFTAMAEPAGLVVKGQSTAHTEWAHLDQRHYEDLLERIRVGRLGERFARRELDDDLPHYLHLHRERLAGLLL
jgi:hypothetical protein